MIDNIKSKFIWCLTLVIACVIVGCSDDDDSPKKVNGNELVGRIYQRITSDELVIRIQFFENNLAVERKYKNGHQYSEKKNQYSVEGDAINIGNLKYKLASKNLLKYGGLEFNLISTSGSPSYTPEEDILGENPGGGDGDQTENPIVRVSTVSGAGEVNFVISVKDCMKEPAIVTLQYLVSPVQLTDPQLTGSREARWNGHPTDKTWLYSSFVLGSKHSYVYYRVRVIVGSKVIVTPINYARITS